ncbi:hypothetical protein AB1Y20_009973 [Prymnesium parvum]|uniref:Uncharacterized protein n=1 Tax=Prymnesium parvum TaxID=97485 RepID=A0AB34K3M4_PRYPA
MSNFCRRNDLRVARLFHMADTDTWDWFLGSIINSKVASKNYFWVKHEDNVEVKNSFYPTGYGKEWIFIKME